MNMRRVVVALALNRFEQLPYGCYLIADDQRTSAKGREGFASAFENLFGFRAQAIAHDPGAPTTIEKPSKRPPDR